MHIQLASGARALNFGLGSSINMRVEKALARCVIRPLVRSAYSKIFLIPTETYVVGTQKNRLIETVLLSTQNICYN